MKRKFQLTIEEELLERLKELSRYYGTSNSAYLSMLIVNEYEKMESRIKDSQKK